MTLPSSRGIPLWFACLLGFGLDCSSPEASGGGGAHSSAGAGGAGHGGSGGARATGGGPGAGGRAGSGGASATGGAAGGTDAAGGSPDTGGAGAAGGASARAGATGSAGARTTGGSSGSADAKSAGGATSPSGGTGGTSSSGDCPITVISKTTSSKIPTVGIVEWSTTLSGLSKAEIVFTLDNAASSVLNTGGRAPVDLSAKNYRTLLLGLKPSSTYSFHIEATSQGGTCKGGDGTITTGALSGAPKITRTATKPTAQAKGFIVTSAGIQSSGTSGGTQAYVIDADGAVVWLATSPAACSRARMDYEGANMWMMAINVLNSGGEMRYVSMDGLTSQNNVSGLSKSHHDFTVLKGGVVATMVWITSGNDPESDLVERDAKGTVTTLFRLGPKVYAGGPSVIGGSSSSFHCNSILYHEADSTYTIGDRNPNVFVKVSRTGQPVWQFGGNCGGAPAPKCATASWTANHGHHLLDDGHIVFFNNGTFNSSSTPSKALEYVLNTSGTTMTATQVKAYSSSSNYHSDSLGDVQRLPNGNTLVVFSNKGVIQEVDSSWEVVQTLSAGTFGYADWRETMYGPPER